MEFLLSNLCTPSLQQFANATCSFSTPALVPVDVSAHGFPLWVNYDPVYPPLSSLGGSSLPCDHNSLEDMSCWFFSVSHTFSLLLLWKWGWHLPSSLHTWCWIGNQKSNFINLLLSHNHTVSGLLILYSSAPAVVVVQLLSHIQFFATPWTATYQAPLSFTISWSLLKLMSIESVMSSKHIILCHPLLLFPSMFPSFRVFSNESVLHIR